MRRWGVILGAGAAAIAAAVASFGGQLEPGASASDAHVEFLVSFQEGSGLERAQRLAARGELQRAEGEAREALSRARDLAGLCFERFTLGGGEMVLSVCKPSGAPERERERWLGRLRALPSVKYADADVVADVNAKP